MKVKEIVREGGGASHATYPEMISVSRMETLTQRRIRNILLASVTVSVTWYDDAPLKMPKRVKPVVGVSSYHDLINMHEHP